MTGKQKTAAELKQLRLEKALRANLGRRKDQIRARQENQTTPTQSNEKQTDESPAKR